MHKIKHIALWITGICIIIFILQNIINGFTDSLILISSSVLERPWTLITSIFLHGSFIHLLYNMLGLALFGTILENDIGSKKFLMIFFAAGLSASFISLFFYNAVLGASGALFGILGVLAVIRAKMTIWVYFIPMPMYVAAIFWVLLDIFGILFPHGIANIAHLAGLGLGIAYGFYIKKPSLKKKEDNTVMFVNEEEMRKWEDKNMR